jgi:ribosome biogenesis GTPase
MSQQVSTVIATYSRRMRLRLGDGRHVDARIKGKRLRPVCGDRVVVEVIPGEKEWLITGIEPRRNALSRPNLRGQAEVLAANIDVLIVVAAFSPQPDWFIVDRYLSAAEQMGIDAIIVVNKADAANDPGEHDRTLDEYAAIGYSTLLVSARTGRNLASLLSLLNERVGILVGQSGVGKSSIINRLLDTEVLPTAEISEKRGEGRHTTVNSVLLELAGGGALIDSPGVRDFAPALGSEDEVAGGFREIVELAGRCRFANCRHLREPDCAVKAAVDSGAMSPRRYESYKRLVNLTLRLTKGR